MNALRNLNIRFAVCASVLLYLASDFFVLNGPLRSQIEHATYFVIQLIKEGKSGAVVARVFNHQITQTQLERAMREHLWLEGKTIESLSSSERKILRDTVLNELIDHELLRIKVEADAAEFMVSEEEINARLDSFAARFESLEAMKIAMKSQGLGTIRNLRDRLTSRIQQEKFLESKIGIISDVNEAEAKNWFDANQKQLAIPERIEVRHIFIATLGRSSEEAKKILDAAMTDLTGGKKDFATLSREISEDVSNKNSGGNLGWMTRSRLPVDFSKPAFAMPLHRPSLIRTKLGWHLVEVTARKSEEARTFVDAKSEVVSALVAIKRRENIIKFCNSLRAAENDKIEVFGDSIFILKK